MPDEPFQVHIEPTTCTYCPEPHPAVSVLFGSVYVVMPTESAVELADELYAAALQAGNKQ